MGHSWPFCSLEGRIAKQHHCPIIKISNSTSFLTFFFWSTISTKYTIELICLVYGMGLPSYPWRVYFTSSRKGRLLPRVGAMCIAVEWRNVWTFKTVGVYTYGYMDVQLMCACWGQRSALTIVLYGAASSLWDASETVSHWLARLGTPSTQERPASAFQCLDHRYSLPCLDFYVGAELHSQACAVSALPPWAISSASGLRAGGKPVWGR